MIRANNYIFPLLNQRLGALNLILDSFECIAAEHESHRDLLALRDPRLRQHINNDLGALNNVAGLVVVDTIESVPRHIHRRVLVLLHQGLRSPDAVATALVKKSRPEVSRLDDDGGYPERADLLMHRLCEPGHGIFGRGVVACSGESLPADQAAEVGDYSLPARAHVLERVARHVHDAEDVGVELVEYFLSPISEYQQISILPLINRHIERNLNLRTFFSRTF